MKADEMMIWHRAEFARFLAELHADADDLIEAFPAIAKPGLLEEDLAYYFIEQNWQTILRVFDPEELEARAETMDILESEEEWHEECLAYDYEYSVRMDEEFCATIIEMVLPFQDLDPAERRGFLSKFRKS